MKKRHALTALALAAPLALAACGDDEKSSSGDSASAPQKVTITATGNAKAPTFAISPQNAKPGAAAITVRNELSKGDTDGQLVYISEEHTDEEIAAELAKAMEGKPVADWFQGGGGPGRAEPGASASATQDLKEGTYYVASGEGKPKLPLAKVEVSGDAGPELSPPAATIKATEYAFTGKAVKAGEPVLIDNAGGEWHHFLASQLKPDATIEQAKKYLMTEKGEQPFLDGEDDQNALETTVLEGGTSQVVKGIEKPGRYAFFCFIADKAGGPPHVVKGMVSEVTVE